VVIVPVIYSREEWEKGPEQSSLLALAVQREGISLPFYGSRSFSVMGISVPSKIL
jgi:hypothetical protein